MRYKIFGDVPLYDAMITWNGLADVSATYKLGIAIVPHPEPDFCRHWKLSNSAGACYTYWRELSTPRRLLQLYTEAWHIVGRDLVPMEMVHDALLVIPEYRDTLSGEEFFADWRKRRAA